MFKISKKEMNKFVASIDRYFTYDQRYKKVEDATEPFEFSAFDNDRHLEIFIGHSSFGVYVSIKKDNTSMIRKYLESYSEMNEFKKWIRLIG